MALSSLASTITAHDAMFLEVSWLRFRASVSKISPIPCPTKALLLARRPIKVAGTSGIRVSFFAISSGILSSRTEYADSA